MSEEDKKIVEKLADLNLPEDFLASEGFKSLDVNADVELTDEIRAKISNAKEKWDEEQKASGEHGDAQPVQGEIKDGDSLEGGDQKPAEKTDELAADEIQLVGNEGDVNVDQDWVQRYEAIMKQYAADNQQEWVREEKNEEGQPHEGLKGKIGEAEYHFTAPDKAKSNLAGIDGVVALAKETGQSLAYNEKWSDEFKAEVLKACQKHGVSIEGMPEQVKENTEEKEDTTTPPSEEEKEGTTTPPSEEGKEDPTSSSDKKKDVVVYSVNPKIATAKMADYSNKTRTPAYLNMLKTEVERERQLYSAGAYASSGKNVEEKVAAEILMKSYAIAVKEGNKEVADNCALALQRYGVDGIARNPNEENGKYTVTAKPYSERTDEEKVKINEALDKALPKKQEQNSQEVIQQLAQAKQAGQVH